MAKAEKCNTTVKERKQQQHRNEVKKKPSNVLQLLVVGCQQQTIEMQKTAEGRKMVDEMQHRKRAEQEGQKAQIETEKPTKDAQFPQEPRT